MMLCRQVGMVKTESHLCTGNESCSCHPEVDLQKTKDKTPSPRRRNANRGCIGKAQDPNHLLAKVRSKYQETGDQYT